MRDSLCLKICHVNVNCLSNKISHISNLLSTNCIDYIGISESWLTSELASSFLSIYPYVLCRADSPSQTRIHGVAVFIKNSIKFSEIPCPMKNVVISHLIDFNLYVITVYRPPSYNPNENQALMSFLAEFCPNKEVILQGDFNLPSLNWNSDYDLISSASPLDLSYFNLFTSDLGLTQIVNEPTNFPSGNTLDLFFPSHSDRIGSFEVLPSCSHSPVLVNYVFQFSSYLQEQNFSSGRSWQKGRYNLISESLSLVDWYEELFCLGAAEQYKRFLDILYPLIERYVPIAPTYQPDKVPWPTNPPRSLCRAKSEL